MIFNKLMTRKHKVGIFTSTIDEIESIVFKTDKKGYETIISLIPPEQILFDDFNYKKNYKTIIKDNDDEGIRILSDGFIARLSPLQKEQLLNIINGGA